MKLIQGELTRNRETNLHDVVGIEFDVVTRINDDIRYGFALVARAVCTIYFDNLYSPAAGSNTILIQ